MKIIKSKINNFLLPLFFLLLLMNIRPPTVSSQNTQATTEEATAPSTTQNQAPAAERPDTLKKKEITTPKKQIMVSPKKQETTSQKKQETKPEENQNPTQSNPEEPQNPSPAEQPEKAEQPDQESKKSDSQTNKSPAAKESKPEPQKELDLPEVSDKEVEENSSLDPELPQTDHKNVIKTIVSWLLMCIGLLIIIKVIVSNTKIPRNYEPHIKNKHGFKSNKRTGKYNLKYK